MSTPASEDDPRFHFARWVPGATYEERAGGAVALARSIASRSNLPLVGVASTLGQLPDGWGSALYKTRRSTNWRARTPSVEIHFWPALDDLAAMPPAGSTCSIVLESPIDDLAGWARHKHAVDFDTGQTLSPACSVEAMTLYERIARNGNNAWRDAPGRRDALRDLRALRAAGELDASDLAGFMIGRRSHRAVRTLVELARRA